MSNLLEVIFVSDVNDHQLTCTAWDFRTGTNLMNYKGGGGGAASRTLSFIRSEYIVAANSTKPLLHVWPINAQEQMTSVRFVVPGPVTALALSPDACYLVAGIQETIYIWHIQTGRMMSTLSKHYQSVTCIKFTSDGSHFVSAGKDGAVLVWNLTQVVARCNDDSNTVPVYSFNDHGLPVTDLHIGVGGMRSYLYTVSLDRSCKIYDLNSGALLLSVVFVEGLQSVISNGLETKVFVGTNTGSIFEFSTGDIPRVKEYHMEQQPKTYAGHSKSSNITCLALSSDDQTLISGGTDNQILVWNIPSRQLVKTLTYKGAITNIQLRLTNPSIFNPEHKQPNVFGANLKRMMDPIEADDDVCIEILVNTRNQDDFEDEDILKRTQQHGSDTFNSSMPNMGSALNNSETQEELESLRNEVKRLKDINRKLFEVSTKQLLRKRKS